MARLFKLLLVAALLIPQSASAANYLESITQFKKPNMKFGKLELHPYYKLTLSYDDNIYLRSKLSGQVFGSMITDNSFGINFKLPVTSMHAFQGGYSGQSLAYTKHPSRNNAYQQNANLGYMFKGPAGTSAKVQNTYMNTQDPASSELVTREQRYQNTAGGSAEYAPGGGNFYVSANADHVLHRYQSQSLAAVLDRYELFMGGRVGYKVLPKTRVYLGYGRQLIHYAIDEYVASGATYDSKNSKSHLFNAGVEGQIAPKVQGMVETGFTFREYDGPETDRAVTTSRRSGSTRNWTVATQALWKPVARTDVSLRVSRSLQESTYAGNRFYISNLVALNFKHKLPYKLTLGMGGTVGIDKYPEAVSATQSNRRDDIYTEFASLTYDIQEYLNVGASYSHKQKNSTLTGEFNYEDQVGALFLGVQF